MKKKLFTAALTLLCISMNAAFAQKETNFWYFGFNAGLDFNSGAPVALTNGALSTDEGCSSISDPNGNLLFYTDGLYVYDRNHTMMPNGDSLGGGWSATQSTIIIPFPANNSMYYIFTVQETAPGELSYSIVDMALNSGNGDVTVKNIVLNTAVTEKLCGVRHSNNTDAWVMVHGYPNDTLFAYPITASGVAATPVINKIGPVAIGNDYRGYMKFSADGTKFANAVFSSNYVDLFDFDASTGILSNEKYLTLPAAVSGQGAQGLEFSLSGHYLYTAQQEPSHIFQWDISSNNAVTINSTLLQIGSSTNQYFGALQMAPDGKIYAAEYNTQFLGVINYPDSSGISCNYVDNAVSLAGKTCRLGLPNFFPSYFNTTGINSNIPQLNQLTIYPNPVSDKLNISFSENASETITVKIFSITGEVVFTEEIKTASDYFTKTMDVTNISNGIYFLNVQSITHDERSRTIIHKKIMVNH
ncbi:MAG: T9SS type A sorting domain-containing protein [Bacteroidota bacterium]